MSRPDLGSRKGGRKAQRAVLILFERVLEPLARLAISHKISVRTVNWLVRKVFVRIAYNEYPKGTRGQTRSRISMLTGIGRSDINQLLNDTHSGRIPDPNEDSRPARVLAGWKNDTRFQDESGAPAALKLRGEAPSFEGLVKKYSSTIPAHTMLEELEASGCIRRVGQDTVELITSDYYPARAGDPAFIQVVGRATARLLETGRHNIERDPKGAESPFFQRQFWVPAVPPDKLEEYRYRLRVLLKRQFEEAKALAEEYEDEFPQAGYHASAGFGMYYFEEYEPIMSLMNVSELDD